ncbi:MAG: putative LPS assembly protein LptD [Marinifilaceae bacterium]|jgi:hypothetical protein|nr:putative LPS assembly protein LptD [Marinifilaceae bacterium]
MIITFFRNKNNTLNLYLKPLARLFLIFTLCLLCFSGYSAKYNKINYKFLLKNSYAKPDSLKDIKKKKKSKKNISDSIVQVKDSISPDSLNKKKAPFTDVVEYSADDSIRFSLTGQKVWLVKNAHVKYGTTELKAYYIQLDLENKIAHAYGRKDSLGNFVDTPEFKDASEEFKCKELKYSFDTGQGLVKEIITEQDGGFVHGELTKKIDDETFYMRNGKYTTCDHEHPHFYIQMTKAKLIKDDKIVSGPLYMVLEDVPLPIGLPFAMFPFSSSYSSGLIIPSYGEEQRRGFNLRGGGYYWAINDYMDLSLTGDIFSNGSWGSYIQSKYKKNYKFSGNLSAEYHFNKFGDKGLSDYSETTDFAIRWSHNQDPKANPYRTFSASVNFSTTNNDRNNSQNIGNIVNNQKQSSISYSKKWPESPFSLNATLRHSQNSIDSTISLTTPSMNFKMTRQYIFRKKGKSSNLKWYDKIGITYSSKLENRINTKEKELKNASLAKDWKNGYQHSIPIQTEFKITKDLTLSPTISYNGVMYTRSIEKSWDDAMNNGEGGVKTDTVQGIKYAHNYSTGISLPFSPKIYGMYIFKETSKLAAIRHVMTPSVTVSYTPEIGVPREKYYKKYYDKRQKREVEYSMFEGGIYGTPTGAKESGSVRFSLKNNVEAKLRTANDTTGNEDFKKIKIIESLDFSTTYDMFKDSLNWSDISMSGSTSIFNRKLSIRVGSNFSPYALDDNDRLVDEFKLRLTRASVKLGFNLSANDLKGKQNASQNSNSTLDTGVDMDQQRRDAMSVANDINNSAVKEYVDFNIPWSFSVNYGWTYSKAYRKSTTNQTFNVSGNFDLTPKWKFNFSSGYDFEAKEITATQFSILRDLHCWQMSFNAIPFGAYQSYNFRINVKSSILQDLKYEKKQAWQDVSF